MPCRLGFLQRAGWLRQDAAYLTNALKSETSKFVILDASCNPLVRKEDGSAGVRDVIKNKSEGELILATLTWKDVAQYYEGASELFSKEPSAESSKIPLTVFLGIDERKSVANSDKGDAGQKTQQSLPKAGDTGYNPEGDAYFALDATNYPELAEKAKELCGGDDNAIFVDLRAELLSVDFETTGVIAEARALIDWNKRNKFCPGCGNQTAPVWAGWKRACLPDQTPSESERPPCVSKKGIHNFAYPRTDPVCIMGVQTADGTKLLLGRQKAWPKGFYSCLAGFIEPGESIEEAVKREIWEEAGVRVEDVSYHSSQPWPFPGSLMIGCLATASENVNIRLDLDNELEHAAFYDFASVKAALEKANKTGLSRHDVEQIQNASDKAEEKKDDVTVAGRELEQIRLPPKTAIATTIISAWVEQREKETARL